MLLFAMKIDKEYQSTFTLVELLVVISIIAILSSFLLPSLISAQKSALALACTSNMRQIMIKTFEYTDANKGFFMPSTVENNATAWSKKAHNSHAMYLDPNTVGSAERAKRTIQFCPSDTLTSVPSLSYGLSNNLIPAGTYYWSYQTNGFLLPLISPDYISSSKNITRLRKPSTTFTFIDGYQAIFSTSHNDQFFMLRHNAKANLAYADGHVASWNSISPLPDYAKVYDYKTDGLFYLPHDKYVSPWNFNDL